MADEEHRLGLGQPIFDADGERLGTVRGFDEHGFYVTAAEGIRALSTEHVRAGHEFGQAELMWRCWACGEMGQIRDDIPSACPGCDAPKEDLYYWQED